MNRFYHFMYRRLLPRSLRGQFALALSALALLVMAGGATAVYTLRTSNSATRELAEERLMRMQDAQDMLGHTMSIQRETYRLLTTDSFETLRTSHADIVTQLAELDRQVGRLAAASDEVAVLDLYQSSQLFQNTANIVAQLRESSLQTEVAVAEILKDRTAQLQKGETPDSHALALLLNGLPAVDTRIKVERARAEFARRANAAGRLPDTLRADLAALQSSKPNSIDPDTRDVFSMRLKLINEHEVLQSFHAELEQQAESLVAAARTQSSHYTREYRNAVQDLVKSSNRNQVWLLAMLTGGLLLAWLIGRVFLGRHVFARLHDISSHLRQGRADDAQAVVPVHGEDEIGDMARAVEQFLKDRHQLHRKTIELNAAQERLAAQNMQLQQEIVERTRAEAFRNEQGRILEMIATGMPLEEVLDSLAHLIESQMEGMKASILLLDEDGQHLRHVASPSLPKTYVQAIDGVSIGPRVGSCGTAMYRQERVIVSDILNDPLWDDFRSLAIPCGLRACWATPILSKEHKAVGTFALYAGEARAPTLVETQLTDIATRIAGIAIERKRNEDRIRHMAHHDALTGLPNRTLLVDRLEQAMLYAQRYGRQVTVVFIDLDNFKLINDSLGHSAGDELLIAVAERMVRCVRRTDTVVRLGGDEFVIILFGQPDQAEAITPTLKKIREAIMQPIYASGHDLRVTCSMGLATYPTDGTDTDTLLRNADAAMYRAKELGRNGYQFYTSDMNAKIQEKLALQDGLRSALALSEFRLLYQPQVDLHSGQIVGVEALIRWQHPKLGMLLPADFISLAEETGLIVPIGDWVLQSACRQNKSWQDAGMPPVTMSVNVSARQFREKDLVNRVEQALLESGLEAKYLELELTESLIMQDLDRAIDKMNELQAMGVKLSVDDFGTGYSSLSALKNFPIARLKIDQSFVRDIPHNENGNAVATAVISLGHKLNLKVIAEGVETSEQQVFLSNTDCDEMQGYHFSKPVSPEEIEQLMRLPVPQS